MAFECAVASVSVVVLEPWGKRGGSFGVGGVDVAVAPRVVGHQAFDPSDAVGSEVVGGSREEGAAGVGAFVIEDLAVREAAVVIDDGVDVVVAGPGFEAANSTMPGGLHTFRDQTPTSWPGTTSPVAARSAS